MTLTALARTEKPADYPEVEALVAAAFGSDLEAELVRRLRVSDGFVPELSVVAEEDGLLVGHVMVTHVELADGDARHRILSLAPLAVLPSRQNAGIGGLLVREASARADARGEPLIVLEGSPAYYSRFGFEHSVRHGITIDLPSWAPPEAAQVLRLSRYRDDIRGKLVYPPAFDVVLHD